MEWGLAMTSICPDKQRRGKQRRRTTRDRNNRLRQHHHPDGPEPQDPQPPPPEPDQDAIRIAQEIVRGIIRRATHRVTIKCTKWEVRMVLTNGKEICLCYVREWGMEATKGEITTLSGSTYSVSRLIVPAWMQKGYKGEEGMAFQRKRIRRLVKRLYGMQTDEDSSSDSG